MLLKVDNISEYTFSSLEFMLAISSIVKLSFQLGSKYKLKLFNWMIGEMKQGKKGNMPAKMES